MKILIAEDDRELRQLRDVGNTTPVLMITAKDAFDDIRLGFQSGVDDYMVKHIFDKFYQADNSHEEEGNGLGLALVKRILAIEKGQITAENIRSGGCRFTVTLNTK